MQHDVNVQEVNNNIDDANGDGHDVYVDVQDVQLNDYNLLK